VQFGRVERTTFLRKGKAGMSKPHRVVHYSGDKSDQHGRPSPHFAYLLIPRNIDPKNPNLVPNNIQVDAVALHYTDTPAIPMGKPPLVVVHPHKTVDESLDIAEAELDKKHAGLKKHSSAVK
jgi:hypothetical protein